MGKLICVIYHMSLW